MVVGALLCVCRPCLFRLLHSCCFPPNPEPSNPRRRPPPNLPPATHHDVQRRHRVAREHVAPQRRDAAPLVRHLRRGAVRREAVARVVPPVRRLVAPRDEEAGPRGRQSGDLVVHARLGLADGQRQIKTPEVPLAVRVEALGGDLVARVCGV